MILSKAFDTDEIVFHQYLLFELLGRLESKITTRLWHYFNNLMFNCLNDPKNTLKTRLKLSIALTLAILLQLVLKGGWYEYNK